MWSDNETTEDLLGFQVHADLVAALVTDPKMLPLTIGIFGDWGSGKTSVMKMLENIFEPDNDEEGSEDRVKYERVACLYFNGWLFEGYDDAKSAILSAILLQLGEHKRFGPKIRDKVASLLKSVDFMRLARLGLRSGALPALIVSLLDGANLNPNLLAGVLALLKGEKQSGNDTKKESGTAQKQGEIKVDWSKLVAADKTPPSPLGVRLFRDQFSDLIAQCEIDALVVLIDDLDRCSPERIIDNLEAIKLFLNVKHTAFVIGADPRIVRHAIATRYKPDEIQELDTQREARDRLVIDYLEKLIQVPYHLPRLSPAEVETYMVLLFCLRDLAAEKAQKCLDACDSLRTRDRYSVFGNQDVRKALGEQGVPNSLSQSLDFCETAAPLITEGLKGNPRQVKRFLNAFVLRKQLAAVAKLANIRDEVLVKLMVLEYSHPNKHRELYEWQAADGGFPKSIQELESLLPSPDDSRGNEKVLKKDVDTQNIRPGWDIPFVQKWIAMKPLLSDVDLRDYFWLSRDRLESTLSDVSMVSPLVRRVLEALVSGNSGKRNTAVKEATQLHEDEKSSLLSHLEEHVHRHPDQKAGYDSLLALIEENIDGAAKTLASVLETCPAQSIPPALAFPFLHIVKQKPELREILQPPIDRLASLDTRIGRAIKKRDARN